MAEVTEKVIEEAADAVEYVAEEVDQLAESIRSLSQIKIQYALIGASIGALGGAAVGFVVANKKAKLKYEKIADEEIAQMRLHYLAKSNAEANETAKEVVGEVVKDLGYATRDGAVAAPVVVETPQVANVFEEHGDGVQKWDYRTEINGRVPGRPYIIHKDEYDTQDVYAVDFEQTTITYYAGDDVLADERDTILDKKDEVVGEDNLQRFGHGSEDPNVVFVRNEVLKMDFEICRSLGTYAKEVHGLDEEDVVQHSAMRRHRSRSFDDER